MSVLGTASRLVGIRFRRKELFPVRLADMLANLGNRVGGDSYRVGSHISDETAGFALYFDSLVQLLCNSHRALDRKTQSPGGILLQGTGDEWG